MGSSDPQWSWIEDLAAMLAADPEYRLAAIGGGDATTAQARVLQWRPRTRRDAQRVVEQARRLHPAGSRRPGPASPLDGRG